MMCSIGHLCMQIRVVIGGLYVYVVFRYYTESSAHLMNTCMSYKYLHNFKLATSLLALQHFGAPSLYTLGLPHPRPTSPPCGPSPSDQSLLSWRWTFIE